jgi:RHS repeat-associated protein
LIDDDGFHEPMLQDGAYINGVWVVHWVSRTGSGVRVERQGSEYVVFYDSGARERYSNTGKLLKRIAPNGQETLIQYDGSNRISAVTGPFGHQLTFNYDSSSGLLHTVADPAEEVIEFAYDSARNLTGVLYPDGTSRQYHYENTSFPNHLTGITDGNGDRQKNVTYDSIGRVASSELADGQERLEFSYAANSTTVTDPFDTETTYSFTTTATMHRVLTAMSKGGHTRSWVVPGWSTDPQRRPTQLTDERGLVTKYTFNSNHKTGMTEAFGTPLARSTTYQYLNDQTDLPTQIEEPNRRTTLTYNSSGNVLTRTVTDLTVTPNVSRTWTYTYNGSGQVLTINGPRTDLPDVTTYTYYNCTSGDECGQVETITNALGHVTAYNTYNAHGHPLTITDPNGVVTTLTYDERQRLTSREVGDETTSFEYWPAGLLKKVTLPDSSFIQYTYNEAHQLTQVEDSEGNYIVYTLDAMGNRVKEETFDPSSYLTRIHHRAFNTLNQLWKEIGSANTSAVTTTFGYDANGNQTSINAPLSRNTSNLFDELNRLKQITDPASGITAFAYNANDNLTSVTDPRGKVTTYTYNGFGDLKEQTSPDTGTTTNTFDSGGNLATATDARSKTGAYTYDALNRVTQLSYPDQTITYSYDTGTNNKGRLMQLSDGSGSTSWTYTPLGRVASRTQSMGVNKTVSYGYNSAGQLTSITTPSGQTVTYGYSNNRISSITVNSTTVIDDVIYDPFGPARQWTWGNSSLTSREFDQDGLVDEVDSAGLRTYSQDDAFRITGITDAVNSALNWSYGYDSLDRLTSASKTGLSQTWTYDANGNRLTQGGSSSSTYTVSSTSNRLSSISGALSRTYGYDSAGNTTSYGGFTFTYNDAGRMTGVSGSGSATYSHNALGQRVKKATGGATTYFVYDQAGHLIGEYDGSGNLIQETVWLEDIPVATLRPNGGSVSIYYMHADHLNTPRRITRPSDAVIVWRWDSDPFGTDAPNQDPDGDLTTFAYNLRFPGQYFDAETALSYNYFRDYDAAIGRYVESDPIGLVGGLNTYAYANQNPGSEFDLFGLVPGAPIGIPRNCEREDWKFCEEQCFPKRVVGCYLSLVRKLKRMRNGRLFWLYEKQSVNCNCEDDNICKREPAVCLLGAIVLGIGSCVAPAITLPTLIVTTPVAAGAQ